MNLLHLFLQASHIQQVTHDLHTTEERHERRLCQQYRRLRSRVDAELHVARQLGERTVLLDAETLQPYHPDVVRLVVQRLTHQGLMVDQIYSSEVLSWHYRVHTQRQA